MKMRNYIKLLAIESICLLFMFACAKKKQIENPVFQETTSETTKKQVVRRPIAESIPSKEIAKENLAKLIVASERMDIYLDSLRGKRVAIVANQSSMVFQTHLVDTLIALGINVQKVFAPEHGFRGTADAGEKVWSHKDPKTGVSIVSLYGNNKKPKNEQIRDVDIVLFDIQDVGVRFYTYISTLHYVMEACAENSKQLIVLDRPNPNAHYLDGPILEEAHKSFIGMHPVPIVYGMTIGEYALMINGENWLKKEVICNLSVVPCENYFHKMKYTLPVAPSPNLRSDLAISLYPSLCFFEATTVSIGRGTDRPFEMYGHPKFPKTSFEFIPMPTTGAKEPLWQNYLCQGYDLAGIQRKRVYELNLSWLINAKEKLGEETFIDQRQFFDRLAGNSALRKQLTEGLSSKEIRETWKDGLKAFELTRNKYLIYK